MNKQLEFNKFHLLYRYLLVISLNLLFKGRNKNQTIVEITLLDVNDNAPQMPVNDTEFEVSENVEKVNDTSTLIY